MQHFQDLFILGQTIRFSNKYQIPLHQCIRIKHGWHSYLSRITSHFGHLVLRRIVHQRLLAFWTRQTSHGFL